jgi:ribose transport system substrate-binding protein
MYKRSFCALMLTALVAAACGNGDTNDPGTGVAPTPAKERFIGMASFTLCCSYFIAMDKAVQAHASRNGVKVESTNADGNVDKLVADIQSLVTKGVSGIIISAGPAEVGPLLSALDSLAKARVPVVLVDRKLKDAQYTSYVGPDNYAIGVADGSYVLQRLPSGGEVGVIRGGPDDNPVGAARTDGLLSKLNGQPSIKVVKATEFGGWSTEGGKQVMTRLLATNPDLKAVFCENDSMCLGAQEAIATAGKTDAIFLVAVDGQKEAIKEILDGKNFVATGRNDSNEIGLEGCKRLIDVVDGKQVEKDTILLSPLITKENAAVYYNPDSLF